MKTIALAITLLLAATAASAQASTHVNGYTRSNGTYVPSHERSGGNSTQSDNWSTKGNTNPYTGQAGTRRDCTYGCR